jgi:hypothetical protein
MLSHETDVYAEWRLKTRTSSYIIKAPPNSRITPQECRQQLANNLATTWQQELQDKTS